MTLPLDSLRRTTTVLGSVALACTLAACSPAAQPTQPAPATGTSSQALAVPSSAPAVPAPAAPAAPSTAAAKPGAGTGSSSAKAATPNKAGTAKKASPATTTSSGPVREGEITRLAVPSVGFDEAVTPVPTTEMGGAIDPYIPKDGSPNLPVRVSDKGVKPATSTDDTTYLGCHTSAHNGDTRFPCNKLIRSAQEGDKILVTTDQGQLTYSITETRSIAKGDFASDDQTWRVEPNRLVFVICDVVGGEGNGNNWVIYAKVAR